MTAFSLTKARKPTRGLRLRDCRVGDGAPVSVQTMTKTDTRAVDATVAQIREVAEAGCDIVRLAVPDAAAAAALREIRARVNVPLVADIHFDYRLALAAIDAGMDGLRLNPGNIGAAPRVAEVARAALDRGVPIRVGVNAGSIEREFLDRYGPGEEAMVESALNHVALLERHGFYDIKVSVKASDPARTVHAYRLLSDRCSYPLHLGVTESGTLLNGAVRSTAALAVLLAEGIGDTLRVSLADSPMRETQVGIALLRAMGLRSDGPPPVIACPTCGRTLVDVMRVAEEVEQALECRYRNDPRRAWPRLAVMGCVVNGPGEAREADLALVGSREGFWLYEDGRRADGPFSRDQAVASLLKAVDGWRPSS